MKDEREKTKLTDKTIKNIVFVVLSLILRLVSVSLIFPSKIKLFYGLFFGEKFNLIFTERIILLFLIICTELTIVYKFYIQRYIYIYEEYVKKFIWGMFLMLPLLWNYSTGVLVNNKDIWHNFQHDSENLVSIGIADDADGKNYDLKYPLYKRENIFLKTLNKERGIYYYHYLNTGINNYDDIINGYSARSPGILAVSDSELSKDVLSKAVKIELANGEKYSIIKSTARENFIIVETDSDVMFNTETHGRVIDTKFIDENDNYIDTEKISDYVSQYGLQGKIFRFISKLIPFSEKTFDILGLICCLLMSLCVVTLCFGINKKYNAVMAICFYVVFLLSPWITNFSRNLYWVEFTWFLPMLVGIYISLNIDSKKSRVISYVLAFISILIKCLCGYEYISTIMVSMMLFIFTDFAVSIKNKDMNQGKLYFKTMVILGISAVMGFIVAVLLHASIRGSGDIVEGIKSIWRYDVLRRTLGTAEGYTSTDMVILNNYLELDYTVIDSLRATIFETICMYYRFGTDIIFGIEGKYFLLMTLVPAGIFVYDWIMKNDLNAEDTTLYLISLFATLSWLVLGKSHSFIHVHMNYVLWYFGFVQICIYIPVNRFIKYIKQGK